MEKCKIDNEKVDLISNFFKSIDLDYYYWLELGDPQLEALKKIKSKCDELCFYRFIVASSLVAYRLKTSGETYWNRLSSLDIDPLDPYKSVEAFLIENKELARNAKIKRLRALKNKDVIFSSQIKDYKQNLGKLYENLIKIYGVSYQKTISFACKMFHYGLITEGIHANVPQKIPIPLDNRVLKVSKSLGLISEQNNISCALLAWKNISIKSGIDQLHLDVFVWRKMYFTLL